MAYGERRFSRKELILGSIILLGILLVGLVFYFCISNLAAAKERARQRTKSVGDLRNIPYPTDPSVMSPPMYKP